MCDDAVTYKPQDCQLVPAQQFVLLICSFPLKCEDALEIHSISFMAGLCSEEDL